MSQFLLLLDDLEEVAVKISSLIAVRNENFTVAGRIRNKGDRTMMDAGMCIPSTVASDETETKVYSYS